MDNVGIVVDYLGAAIAFFLELGMELEGETMVEGRWADRVARSYRSLGVQRDLGHDMVPTADWAYVMRES
jgi:hypothetical protein